MFEFLDEDIIAESLNDRGMHMILYCSKNLLVYSATHFA